MHTNNETASVILTFETGVWFFRATHRLDMLNTFQNGKLLPGHESMHINTETTSVILTFEIGCGSIMQHVVLI